MDQIGNGVIRMAVLVCNISFKHTQINVLNIMLLLNIIGKTGRVMDIRGWDNESGRSVATVTWSTGSTNVYRLGYKGCVDLCYTEEASAGTYYKEHLPLLGQPVSTVSDNGNDTMPIKDNVSTAASSPHHVTFIVGDKVKVLIDVDTLKEMLEGHGGWNPRMAEYIGKVF